MKAKFWLLLHLAAGLLLAYWRGFSTFWGAGAFFFFFVQTLRTRNRSGWAHYGAAYIVGLEVLLRMTKAGLFWEFGKLASLALLTVGLVVERRRRLDLHYLLMIVLLLPALFLADELSFNSFRQMITFQLGGIILLALSCIYFSRRFFSLSDFSALSRWMLYPILSMAVYLFLRTPELSQITFTTSANFATSGGFGPNQVSTALGLGILLLSLNFILKSPSLFGALIDKLFLGILIFRALLTFSRGGVTGAVLALLLAYLVYLFAQRAVHRWRMVVRLLLAGVLFVVLFQFVNTLTQGVLWYRFKGVKFDPVAHRVTRPFELETASSGRTKIVETDIAMWLDYPILGVGVGMSNALRSEYGYRNISHLEQTRLLAEHGLLGLLVLFWLLFLMYKKGTKGPPVGRLISSTFMLLVFFTMLHSATRLAMTGFLFGLGMVVWYNEADTLHRQSPVHRQRLSFGSRGYSGRAAAGL